jgi:hypothetical protein
MVAPLWPQTVHRAHCRSLSLDTLVVPPKGRHCYSTGMDDENLAARTQLGYTSAIADLNFTNKNNGPRAQLQILPLRPILSSIRKAIRRPISAPIRSLALWGPCPASGRVVAFVRVAHLADGFYDSRRADCAVRTAAAPFLPLTRLQRSGSADERGRLVNEACIVDLLDKEVRHVGARDEPGAPVARVDEHAIRSCTPPVG